MTDKCPKCGTELAYTGAPIHEDYCPNKNCTYEFDQMVENIRKHKLAHEAGLQAIRAGVALLPELKAIFQCTRPSGLSSRQQETIIAALEAADSRFTTGSGMGG